MVKLKDKVAVVTGAGKGIGLEISKKLAAAGARVILNDIDRALAERSAAEIGSNCRAVPGDASDPETIQRLADTAVTEYGQLDIAIANAGITLFGEFLTYPPEDFYRLLQVNLGGTFFLAQAAAQQMKKQPHGGSLLFISSVTGHQAHKKLAAYGMTKAAIEMLAKNLVIDLSPYQININAIAPGATATERTLKDPDYEKNWSRLTPMGRPAKTADIAHAALFMVSEEARHITGQTLIVDGGWSAISPSPS